TRRRRWTSSSCRGSLLPPIVVAQPEGPLGRLGDRRRPRSLLRARPRTYTRGVNYPYRTRNAVVGTLLALVLALTSGGAAHAFDWPRDPAKRPVPEAHMSTKDAEADIAAKLDAVL